MTHDTDRAAPRGPAQRRAALAHFISAVRADHDMMRRYDERYDRRDRRAQPLAKDLVERMGFQMMAAYRLMRGFVEAGVPLGAKVMGRAIRLVYGSDIHWDAAFDDGVVIVHGMGLAISHAACVGPGVIISHNVTIGDGVDPETRAAGAPRIEAGVHIGPGATLIGPITIGAGSKIMPGAVVTRSVPPGSLVEVPAPRITPRRPRPEPKEEPNAAELR